MPALDIFSSSAFSMVTLTDAINKMPYVPGRIGQLGLFREQGVSTTSVMIEEREGSLNLVETTARGAPAVQNTTNKRKARWLVVPHIALEDTVDFTGGSVTYSNNLEKIETIRDDGLIEAADPTIAALIGRIDVRFADTTLIDLAAGGTPVDLEFAYTLSAQAKLVFSAHEVYLPQPKLAVEGPGGVQASFDFRGAKNTVAGRMLTVTLTNDLDGLVYG